jgi:hypothetical protein
MILIFLFTTSFAQALTEIKVGKGDLKIGGILQAGFTYNVEDDAGTDAFWMKRGRFLFWGTIIPDKVKYFVQLDHAGGVSLLDYKAQFFYIEKTEITFGRFLPNFTLYMPYSTAKLELINYPMTTTKYAMWRQVGLQAMVKTDYVHFTGGIFNGADIPNNTSDNNDAKDFLGRVDVMPPMEEVNLHFGGYAWIGSSLPTYTQYITHDIYDYGKAQSNYVITETVVWNFPDETLERNRFGGFVKADYTKDEMTFRARGEYIQGSTESLYYQDVDSVSSVDSRAFFGQASIQPVKQVEILARYEAYDPNTDVDDDGISAITGGVNYYMDGINAMLYLNYIHKMEEGDEVDNDEVQAQVQITF